jgi:hypothetical protein
VSIDQGWVAGLLQGPPGPQGVPGLAGPSANMVGTTVSGTFATVSSTTMHEVNVAGGPSQTTLPSSPIAGQGFTYIIETSDPAQSNTLTVFSNNIDIVEPGTGRLVNQITVSGLGSGVSVRRNVGNTLWLPG